jgi:hypothetical protein
MTPRIHRGAGRAASTLAQQVENNPGREAEETPVENVDETNWVREIISYPKHRCQSKTVTLPAF